MSQIGDKIKQRREQLGLSQDELAKELGYKSRSSINKIENNERSVPQNKIQLLASLLQVDTDYLMGWSTTPQTPTYEHVLEIPVYDALSCGIGGYVDAYVEEYIPLPKAMLKPNKQYFANYASGDSMVDEHIFDRDLLIFEQADVLRVGDVGSFHINNEESTCKIFTQDKQTKQICLQPANPAYEPIYIEDMSQFRIIGKLALVINNRQS